MNKYIYIFANKNSTLDKTFKSTDELATTMIWMMHSASLCPGSILNDQEEKYDAEKFHCPYHKFVCID